MTGGYPAHSSRHRPTGRALLRNGDLEGIQIGGRGQWRIEDAKLEEYIERMYEEQRQDK